MNTPRLTYALPVPLLKPPEVARVLGVAERTLRAMNARGDLTYVKFCGEVRYEPGAIIEFIGRHTRLATGQAPALLLPADWARIETLLEALTQSLPPTVAGRPYTATTSPRRRR